jgi:hypothetical protein
MGFVGLRVGNTEALVLFQPRCRTSTTTSTSTNQSLQSIEYMNQESPPCASSPDTDAPSFKISVSRHANNRSHPHLLG